jgi:hypothetical protein
MEHSGARDPVSHLTRGFVPGDFAQALAAQEKQGVPDFLVCVVEPLASRHLADVRGGDRNFLAAIQLQQAFVPYFV